MADFLRFEAFNFLGLPLDASLVSIKEAYHRLIRLNHPDKVGKDADKIAAATEKFIKINSAYKTLLNPQPQQPRSQPQQPRPQPQQPPQYQHPSKGWNSPPVRPPPQESWSLPQQMPRKRKFAQETQVVEIDGVPLSIEELNMIRKHRAKKQKRF